MKNPRSPPPTQLPFRYLAYNRQGEGKIRQFAPLTTGVARPESSKGVQRLQNPARRSKIHGVPPNLQDFVCYDAKPQRINSRSTSSTISRTLMVRSPRQSTPSSRIQTRTFFSAATAVL